MVEVSLTEACNGRLKFERLLFGRKTDLSAGPSSERHGSITSDQEVDKYLKAAAERIEEEAAVDSEETTIRDTVIVLDFGSQYNQLIARRVRECNVYCELLPHDTPWDTLAKLKPKGFILSGGPSSVYDSDAPQLPVGILESGIPILGICYGMQIMAQKLGGIVAPGERREYGHAVLQITKKEHPLFQGMPDSTTVWMSHGDHVVNLPLGFESLAQTENSPVAAMANEQGLVGLQFHPEVVHTPLGKEILKNFLYKVCGCAGNWTPKNFVRESVEKIRNTVGTGKVLCGLSGGVDSAVAATLIHEAIGDQLVCVFVNNGLLRKGEAELTLETFRKNMKVNVVYVDATDRFLAKLEGITDPEAKRIRIGEEFIRVFEAEARALGKIEFLAQGTLYPDVIESVTPESKASAKIKTHHNVGGLPADMTFKLVEPLRYLFKDEVREVGLALGLPEEMVYRQPFPGPGLAIRIIGEVNRDRLETLREADAIVTEEIRKAGLNRQLWQSFAILTSVKSVGVMGDGRTYGYLVAIRAVTSEDAMTADWARLPYDLLAGMSNRIVNEVSAVNRVVYDISSKPPATIEWE